MASHCNCPTVRRIILSPFTPRTQESFVRQISLLGTLAVLGIGSSPASPQQAASLSKPSAETKESFTSITAIRELPSGKVLVADAQDKVVQLVDFTGGSITKVGREGNGPGEYSLPLALAGLPDGSTLVHDILNRRFLIIGADGKPGGFLELPRPPAANSGGAPVIFGGIQQLRGYDNQGRLYFRGSPFTATGGTADSVPLLRWDRVKPAFDTVGYLKLPPGSASRTGNGNNVQIRMGNNVRFTPTENWSIAGDGSIARVIPEPYRVIWLTGRGAPVAGPVVPYTPIKVTEADKKEIIDAQKKNAGGGIRMVFGGGPGGGSGGGPPPNIQAPPPEFADTKPPFDGAGGNSVLATPEGEVWVLRTRPAGDKIPTYDVFDHSGTLVKKVSLNPSSRVVGFGKGTIYVVRIDEDDLQYLQRYARP
jgi:hypothetical protein